ncbi:anti-sigma factor [Pelagibacterium montanilacus]|uniref:anti-sigma factor n=1 Tax=Pelagibacterium montanilacus TaxID=2185280 RepID=UPI000F8F79C0|nr:anti-sigma factor [Pelagibacterium montanilacus]
MSEPTGLTPPEDRDVRAGELVLGLLEGSELDAARRAVETDPEFAQAVARWQADMARFDDAYEEVAPPARVYEGVEARLFATARPAARWYDSLAFWRASTAAAALVAAIGIGLYVWTPEPAPQTEPQRMVAALAPTEGEMSALAFYSGEEDVLRFSLTSGPAGPDNDYELWAIVGEDAPVSLGVVSPGEGTTVALSPQTRALLDRGVALAVSLEPAGGSPTDGPTGPVLALGTVTTI